MQIAPPKARGLYDPQYEHDACGIGAVVNISGRRDHAIVEHGKQVLLNLHAPRGGRGRRIDRRRGRHPAADSRTSSSPPRPTGWASTCPRRRQYGVAMLFLPQDDELRRRCEEILAEAIDEDGLKRARLARRADRQPLPGRHRPGLRAGRSGRCSSAARGWRTRSWNGGCIVARKRAERRVRETLGDAAERVLHPLDVLPHDRLQGHVPGPAVVRLLSRPGRRAGRDGPGHRPPALQHEHVPQLAAGPAVPHDRPQRRDQHAARQHQPAAGLREDDGLPGAWPRTCRSCSRSCSRAAATRPASTTCMELLVRAGRSAPARPDDDDSRGVRPAYHIATDKRAFYEYHAAIMEPWDGPAAMVFTDGRLVGGTLDRNGLRPCRYVVTTDGLVVLASEVGVIEFPPEQIQQKGRLQPGRMFLVDTEEGRIVVDNEIKGKIARQKPYRRWLEENRIELRGLFQPSKPPPIDPETLAQRLRAFGYTREDLQMIVAPMAANGQEPVGSMGTDTPLAVLSEPAQAAVQLLQAAVRPGDQPADRPAARRAGDVADVVHRQAAEPAGRDARALPAAEAAAPDPDQRGHGAAASGRPRRFQGGHAAGRCSTPTTPIPARRCAGRWTSWSTRPSGRSRDGASLLILSDRDVSPSKAPIPSLLATAALHHGLLRRRLRSEAGIVVESGEPREVMHFCLLCGYGANAINPYLAFEAIHKLHADGDLPQDVDRRPA